MNATAPRSLRALTAALLFTLAACAHSDKRVDYPATANPADEIASLERDLASAVQDQVDVLSPDHFKEASDHLANARRDFARNKSSETVLNELGRARWHYLEAQGVANSAQYQVPEVLKAREDARTAGAPAFYSKEFRKIDEDFKDIGERFEDGKADVTNAKRSELQRRYLDIELATIKKKELNEARALIDGAKENGARKHAPRTLDSALAKVNQAEAVIEADRHNTAVVGPAVRAATAEAKRLAAVTEYIRDHKGKVNESAAVALVDQTQTIQAQRRELSTAQETIAEQQIRLQREQEERSRKEAELSLKAQNLSERERQLQLTEREKAELAQKQKLNETLDQARNLFAEHEAEVYRQGNQLLIRLKGVQFAAGRSELPRESYQTLAKVKNVIEMLDAEKVVVEGHTDSSGAAKKNLELSAKRADAVAEYLVSENAVSEKQVETRGFGFNRPISSEKTPRGRAQNRRVDIVVTPSSS